MKKILLIDDDPVDGFVTQQILRHIGFPYELHYAIHGLDGMKMLSKLSETGSGCPDIILLDLYMPMMDGLQFLEQFALLDLPGKENTRVIVLTLSHDMTGPERALKSGATGVLHKPLQIDELRQLLQDR